MNSVLVVYGSRTSEDSYGVTSGNRVAEALRVKGWRVEKLHAREGRAIIERLMNRPPKVVVPVGFGAPTEDGHIFGLARLCGVPCAGPTPAAGALMQDKYQTSLIVDAIFDSASMVRSPRGFSVTRKTRPDTAQELVERLSSPLLVKPSFSGSSEGLLVTNSADEALSKAQALVEFEGKVLVQELEQDVATEVSCTVLDTPEGPRYLPVVEIRKGESVVFGVEEKFGATSLDRHIIPARIESETAARLEAAVLKLHEAVGAKGLTRTDVLVKRDGELVVLELNGIPGLLRSSIACDAARAAGLSFEDLCEYYLASAYLPRNEPNIWGAIDGLCNTR